jgi:uncharacterized oxidoreductase
MLVQQTILEGWLSQLFTVAGCPREEAYLIAIHLVDADASGHPSHGIVRVPRYMDYIQQQKVRPICAYTTLMSSGALRLFDGQYSFGQVLGHHVVREACKIVQSEGLALIGLRHAGHLGRIGSWAELLADQGLISLHFVNVAGSRIVAPFGGRQAQLSTAPIAIGVPRFLESGESDHFILDFATSRVAEGKILVSLKTGTPLPLDAMVDETGTDSNHPATIYGETATSEVPNPRGGTGAIQTFGEHKGSGLGLACELLAGALTGLGTNAHERPFCNGMLSIVFDPTKFDQGHGMRQEIEDFITSIRNSAPRHQDQPVLTPGDPERAMRKAVRTNGIELGQVIYDQLIQISTELSVAIPDHLGNRF